MFYAWPERLYTGLRLAIYEGIDIIRGKAANSAYGAVLAVPGCVHGGTRRVSSREMKVFSAKLVESLSINSTSIRY